MYLIFLIYETDSPDTVDLLSFKIYYVCNKSRWDNSLVTCDDFIFVFYNKYEKEIFGMEKFNTQKNLKRKQFDMWRE